MMITLQKLTQKPCQKDKDMIISKIRNFGYKKMYKTVRNRTKRVRFRTVRTSSIR